MTQPPVYDMSVKKAESIFERTDEFYNPTPVDSPPANDLGN